MARKRTDWEQEDDGCCGECEAPKVTKADLIDEIETLLGRKELTIDDLTELKEELRNTLAEKRGRYR